MRFQSRDLPPLSSSPPSPLSSITSVCLPSTDSALPTSFAYGGDDGSLTLRSSSSSSRLSLPAAVNDLCYSGDARRLAASLEDGSVCLIDPERAKLVDSVAVAGEGSATCACFSPQSSVLVVGSYSGAIRLYDTRAPRRCVRKLSPAHGCPVSQVAFHRDGTVFLSTGLDGLARVWDVTGPCLATLIGSSERGLGSGCFSPNGRYALLGALDDGALGLWDLADPGSLKRVRRFPRVNSKYWLKATFSETGLVVGGSENGKLTAWNAADCTIIDEVDLNFHVVSGRSGPFIPLACAVSKSVVVCGGLGSPHPLVFDLVES